MSKLVLLLSVYYLYSLLLLLNNSNTFTMELIHPNPEERTRMLVSPSIVGANSITQRLNEIARPIIDIQETFYIAKIGIGTFKSKPPFAEYYLLVDTGSTLSWMQCEGCKECFNQIPEPFPKSKSTSFHLIDTYFVRYLDGSRSSGIMAKETLHLNSNTGRKKQVQEFIFGCGLQNPAWFGLHKNNRIAGILGLGWGDHSFVNQIKEAKGKFSYCLPLATKKRATTYLRFGDDIVVRGSKNPRSTSLIRLKDEQPYYLGLEGISIIRKRLNISKDVFALKLDGPRKGGCIIDSGTAYSRVVGPAYDKLKQGLEDYFSKDKNMIRINGSSLYLFWPLCYERRIPMGFKKLPDITFHLEGSNVDFHVKPQGGFIVERKWKSLRLQEYVCLAMLGSDYISIIGAHQQTNQRIIFDTQKKKLIFHPEDCSKNP